MNLKKKIKYRPAGSMMDLVGAMERCKEISNNYDEFLNMLKKEYYWLKPNKDNVIIKFHCYDKRIKWQTYLVCIDNRAVVFTNGLVKGIKTEDKNDNKI